MKQVLQFILLVLFGTSSANLSSQNVTVYAHDSLKGFDETIFINQNVSLGFSGLALKKRLQTAKKEYIFEKYYHNHGNQLVWKTPVSKTINPGCTNMDFETGSFSGWNVSAGINTNSSTMAGCCASTVGIVSQVIASVGNDPIVGAALPLTSPFGGTKIAKINDANTGAVVERISQSFSVTSANAIFQFAYAGVLEDAAHSCSDQPFMNVSVIDSSGNILACPKIEIAAPSPACTQPASVSANWTSVPTSGVNNVYYHNWEVKTIDLSPYIGTSITIQITVGDCALSGHFGYGYFDCKCYPLEINLSGTLFDATPQTPINVSTCGAISATVTAPYGLNPYLWNGPAASGVVAVTTQSIATSTPATYTLVMSPVGTCYGPITKFIILNVTPNPTVTNVTSQATCTNATGSGTINVTSGTSPFHYNWLPAASTNSIATGLAPGTDYTVTVVDTFGCKNSTIVSIASFTNGPTYTISPLGGVLTCNTPSLTLSATTDPNTTVAVWTNTTTSSFDVTSAGTFSCILTNTVSSCTSTVPITITANTITPIATYTVNCNTTTISLNASSSGGIALGWLAPTSPVSPVSNPGTSTASGIFTLTATNLSTGCKSQYTVSTGVPDITIVNTPSSNLLTCITSSISALASSTSSSITITWFNGISTSSINPQVITTAGTYTSTISQLGGCSTQSVITITTNTAAIVSISVPTTTISCLTNSLALTGNGVGGAYTYTWIPNSPAFVGNPFNVINAGTYTVIGTNAVNGCTATASQTVSHETINASFIADTHQGLMPLPLSFTNTSINPTGTTYIWDLGNSTIGSSSVITTTYNTQGVYPVFLTATKGFCQDTAVQFIKVDLISIFKIPNVFTPNGDGVNDLFLLDATNMGEITMTIFDRWGLKMLESTDVGKMIWDGKTKGGHLVADGTYFYVIKATGLDGALYDLKGTINVFK